MKQIKTLVLIILIAALSGVLLLRAAPLLHLRKLEPAPAATAAPAPSAGQPEETEAPALPEEEYVISLVGDCTLWSNQNYQYHSAGFAKTMGDDYAYPFSHTAAYFQSDELTLANCECTLTDDAELKYDYTKVMFPFRAPTVYAEVFKQGGVDFVTTANNHMMDCYEAGAESTYAALAEHGVPYGREGQAQILTTPHGLKIGVYCSGTDLNPDQEKALEAVRQLRADGAEYIICAFHWGQELYYTPEQYMIDLAHACIDAGADLIYGSHSHCLQPVEEYGEGLILYSCGNWVFGGSTMPTDPDTAIFQVSVKYSAPGKLSRTQLQVTPCCVSSNIAGGNVRAQNYNDYCPTPYEPDSDEARRAISKLTGEYEPAKQGADYSSWYKSRG